MGRMVDADAFSAFIKDAVIKHKYDRLNIDNTLTVADVLQSVCAELDGTGLEGFKNAPTVDAVPVVHGRWIPCFPLGDGTPEGYMCSVCHVGGWEKTNFCPHCRADMREDGEQHDS